MSLQEAILNTAVKIKSCTRASAAGKNEYNLDRTKNKDQDILVLEKNGMPDQKNTLTKEQKKEIKSLQSKLSTYKKRLDAAIENGKEKSIKTNSKNIAEIEKKLSKIERSDKREKHFTEFTIALTNSQGESYENDWSQKALDHIKKEFPDLEIVSAVEHRDQHSPHMHILLHSQDKPITQVLAEHTGQKDTSRESMKEAYSKIAHDFHSFANEKIAHNELKPLQKGRKYVSLGQYKQKGNFEAKKALRDKNNSLPELNKQKDQVEDALRDARIFLKEQDIGEHALEVHTIKGMLGTKHFITDADINRKKESLDKYVSKAEEILSVDGSGVRKEIRSYFGVLEENSKKTKDRQQPHFDKEPGLKVNLDYFKEWRKSFNEYLKAVDGKIKEQVDKLKERGSKIQEKISKNPETIKHQKQEQIKRDQALEKIHQKRGLRNQNKDRGRSR